MNPLLAELRGLDPAVIADWPRLRCPVCAGHMSSMSTVLQETGKSISAFPSCQECRYELVYDDGIWNALPPNREPHYRQFIAEYETVRSLEGRGSNDPAYYLSLPFRDLTGHNGRQWQIRGRTCRYLESRILPRLRRQLGRPLDTLDLGAGNGWLSYRLSLLGHRAVAVDLLVNPEDGLGAARHYLARLRTPFPRFRAELDRLPFADCQFDCAIFNASFHYSENYERTLREAVRCLRRAGQVIIADTAWYSNPASGDQMLAERREAFLRRYGFTSDALNSQEFLTDGRLNHLALALGIRWEAHQPWYGLGWAMRPWIARWKKRREPSRFQIYVGQVCA
jgi:SAM-dependent methyltransferase